jgi:hypothetical protein
VAERTERVYEDLLAAPYPTLGTLFKAVLGMGPLVALLCLGVYIMLIIPAMIIEWLYPRD